VGQYHHYDGLKSNARANKRKFGKLVDTDIENTGLSAIALEFQSEILQTFCHPMYAHSSFNI